MKPDARMHNPDPDYFRQLVESTGMTVGELAKLIGHDERTIRRWMYGERKFTYAVQFIVEAVCVGMSSPSRIGTDFSARTTPRRSRPRSWTITRQSPGDSWMSLFRTGVRMTI